MLQGAGNSPVGEIFRRLSALLDRRQSILHSNLSCHMQRLSTSRNPAAKNPLTVNR
jgi:hypothetical protein